MAVGTETKYTNVPVAVEAALKQMGYTAQEPSDVLSTEAQNPTTVTELCNTLMVGQCNPTILKYANDNPNQTLWPMNQSQIAAAKEEGVTVFNQADLESGLTSNKRKLKLAGKESYVPVIVLTLVAGYSIITTIQKMLVFKKVLVTTDTKIKPPVLTTTTTAKSS